MRTLRLKNLDTVFLLGAGASYSCTLPLRGKSIQSDTIEPSERTTPLDKDFNKRLLKMSASKREAWIEESLNEIKSNWIGEEEFEKLGLETAIIKRTGNYDLLNAIHPVRLNGKERRKVLRELHSMNISQATLFPDLGGFAQSLRTRIADPETISFDVPSVDCFEP